MPVELVEATISPYGRAWSDKCGIPPLGPFKHAFDPCSQSQIGRGRHLRRKRARQVAAAVVLSVVVRWEPTLTVVNGTLVARPVRLTSHTVVP